MGEATLLSMLGVGALFAAVFLLLPFAAVHNTWRELPRKRAAALYFSMLGLGFMFFEIGMLQKLTLFLGYPTYSLSVTLFSLLVFAGIGSYATERHIERGRRGTGLLVGIIAALTLFYQFGLDHIVNALFGSPLPLRIAVVVIALLPLGLCLGTFMPIGLSTVSALTPHKATYVAWGWAVNGFFSVMGSILATILSMAYGFRFLLFLGLLLYVAAAFGLRWLAGGSDAHSSPDYAAGRARSGVRDES